MTADMAAAGIHMDQERWGVGGGWLWAEPSQVAGGSLYHRGRVSARATLPGVLTPLAVSGGSTIGITGIDSGRAGIDYIHPSRCVALGLRGELAVDGPTLGINTQVFPRRAPRVTSRR